MVAATTFKKLVISFEAVSEKPHFHKTAFSVNNKIFTTLDPTKDIASVKLTEIDQSIYCKIRPAIAKPATGAWGKQGWTVLDLKVIPKGILTEALEKAYQNLAQTKKPKMKVAKMANQKIQTLHPDKSKTNKNISLEKYNTIKEALINILQQKDSTHTELMESLYQKVKDHFEGGVQWYGETVKLDLEARKMIVRTGTKPEKYQLKV